MKPQIEKLPVARRVYVGNSQKATELQLCAKESQNVKVLSACGDVTILSSEALLGEVSYLAKLNVKVIVCDDDKNTASLNYNVDFSDSFSNENISPDARVEFVPVVTEIDCKTEGNIIDVRVVTETKIFAYSQQEKEIYGNCEGLGCRIEEVSVNCQKTFVQKNFSLVDEIELKHEATKILLAESQAVVSDIRCDEDVVSVLAIYTRPLLIKEI